MTRRFEVVFSMYLREDISVETLHELHWQLGLGASKPEVRVLASDQPVLTPSGPGRSPGEEMVALQRQYRFSGSGREHDGWGLHARLYWRADQWSESWLPTATWLAAHAADDGYAGFYRAEHDEAPNVFFVRDGKPYLSESGRQPSVLTLQS